MLDALGHRTLAARRQRPCLPRSGDRPGTARRAGRDRGAGRTAHARRPQPPGANDDRAGLPPVGHAGSDPRNVLENPAWYTAYTPYQPEISQGRLEVLLNFQTVITDLTGLHTAGASLLDESTAAAEAMQLAYRVVKGKRSTFLVDADTLPQTVEVVRTRAEAMGIDVVVADLSTELSASSALDGSAFGLLLAYPGAAGELRDPSAVIAQAKQQGVVVAVATDLLALTLSRPPANSARTWRGQHPALRLADVVRRPARRLPRRPLRPGAAAARAVRRRLGRRRRLARLPAHAADPRAAHPAGEGDEQHLHGAGAAGGAGLDVRGLPRAGGPGRHRADGARPRRRAGRRPAGGRRRGRPRPVLRHRAGPGVRSGCGGRRRRAEPRGEPAPGRRRPRRDLLQRDDARGRPARGAGVVQAAGGAPAQPAAEATGPDGPSSPAPFRRSWYGRRRSSSTRSSAPTGRRRRCCATCGGSPTRTWRSTGG